MSALTACTSVSHEAIVERRADGVTHQYARPASQVFVGSEQALESLRSSPEWKELVVTERDPARGVLVAERDLRSVIPGLAVKDAFGVFIAPVTADSSDVTFVAMAGDQIPGSTGTKAQSYATGEATFFPALDTALARLPETASAAANDVPSAASTGSGAAIPSAPVSSPSSLPAAPRPVVSSQAIGSAATSPVLGDDLLDRAYALLRQSSQWRPLSRETTAEGTEEVRIGGFARLTVRNSKLILHVRDQSGAAARAANLALELAQAGLPIEVTSESSPERRR